uniref:Ring finger protein 133 n=1 Tax=Canis lupus dingo TaxID=286419 RepID=A0A8C0JFQ0_CANLU
LAHCQRTCFIFIFIFFYFLFFYFFFYVPVLEHVYGPRLGEAGVFGRSSALKRVAGVLAPPEGRAQSACQANTSFGDPPAGPWLALIARGGCTFTQKIRVAVGKGASGVIIYNFPGTGSQVFPMSHQAFEGVVVLMIGNLKGVEMLHLIQKGVRVTVLVDVGRRHIIWMNHYFVSFAIVTTATLAYFIFYHIWRLWVARIQSRRRQRLTTHLKQAFGQLQLRVLKEGDAELGASGDSCVVCFELYKPDDTVRILTCKHLFHKDCIDPWILAHGTCPMCKCDILKALGVQVDVEDGAESLQVLMSSELSAALSPGAEGTRTDLGACSMTDPTLEDFVVCSLHERCSPSVFSMQPHWVSPFFSWFIVVNLKLD